MMNSGEAHPRYEATQYHDYGFDLQEDFSQFLEEARQHGKEEKLKSCSSSVHPEESRGQVKEKKKSWKSSMVSWLKSENKSNTNKNKNNNNSTQSNAYSHNNKNHDGNNVHGPLTSFFKGTKRKESGEIPYMSLHHGNHAKSQNYGPLYMVT